MKLENRERVLVADDDQSIRQLLGTIIKRERLEVDLAPDGAEAIAHLKRSEYSVILLDLMMPRVDGFGVIQYLRDHPQTHKPVVIVITAYADQRFKEVDAEIVSGILRKPFDVADVGSLVRHCISGFKAAIQKKEAESDETLRILSTEGIERLRTLRGETPENDAN
jgi:CheY-like chemotaxis protein